MSTRVVERVDDWSSRSFTDGYHELHSLADREFSGVVRAGGVELFMTGGVVVGIHGGDMGDFEDAEGTVFDAPDPALPLLAVMQKQSDEVRAKYYTEDTPISEVDDTLSNGGFSGYVELSENVLSGDYFIVYHGGESMAVAFVGESKQLLTDQEAFDTADDEVGIYEVRPVDVTPLEIPEAKGEQSDEPDEPAASAASSSEEDEPTSEQAPSVDEDTEEQASADEPSDSEAGTGTDAAGGAADSPEATSESGPSETGDGARDTQRTPATDATQRTEQSARGTSSADSQGGGQRASEGGGSGAAQTTGQSPPEHPGQRAQRGAGALETQSIPSLDPGRSVSPITPDPASKPAPPAGRQGTGSPRTSSQEAPTEQAGRTQSHQQSEPEPSRAQAQPPTEAVEETATERIDELESKLDEREAEIERLENALANTEDEQEELRDELADLRAERDELAEEVERLSEELERIGGATGESTEQRMTPEEALSGTDIFVRYHSKGQATLEKAHGGNVPKDDVTGNLRLETHTQFDGDAATVAGTPFEAFLESRHEYQFVRWVVEDLLFEIRDTGQADALRGLFDAIPKIDRAELHGVVESTYTENDQETTTEEAFDVVLRDKMGNPLLVANFNDSREGASESMMTSLVTAAERVGTAADTFACAFLVTRSFFEPGALETASEATRSGLLSRDKRRSFVNLSRKQGYHLCLVEARNENFHLAVPEL